MADQRGFIGTSSSTMAGERYIEKDSAITGKEMPMRLFDRLHGRGIPVPHHKDTARLETSRIVTPRKVILPMSMHAGTPAELTVRQGERVSIGTLVGRAAGTVSANIHASVSGVVEEIGMITLPGGKTSQAIAIHSDVEQVIDPQIRPPMVTDKESFLAAVKNCGLVGLGGAGFPTHVKLAADGINTLLINAAECEPYKTSDTREILECGESIETGMQAVLDFCGIPHCVIGIEDNKPECIVALYKRFRDDTRVEIKVLSSNYPQGAKKTLIYNCTGLEVPVLSRGQTGRSSDAGVLVMNVTSVSTLGKYLKTGLPLVSRRLTLAGDACRQPMNLEVPVGTMYSDVIKFCGQQRKPGESITLIAGGPMMGTLLDKPDYPVLKQHNALIFLSEQTAKRYESGPCIRCGQCIRACPMGLEPVTIAKSRSALELAALHPELCMSCGSCSYVCPAKRRVKDEVAEAKAKLRQAEKEGA